MNAYVRALSHELSPYKKEFLSSPELYRRYGLTKDHIRHGVVTHAAWVRYSGSPEFAPTLNACRIRARNSVAWMDAHARQRPEDGSVNEMLVSIDTTFYSACQYTQGGIEDDSFRYKPPYDTSNVEPTMQSYDRLGGRLARNRKDYLPSKWIHDHANDAAD